ncbi:MAG: methionyl-tRNA formyltransferase [Candidatus Doudnabacteria bacterium CG10_big_fil_rev_8_21_14_0_10_41_10]|uniref:Methionyl-tRNA formyltransferase n=1 Tax=Candidatus Doudnabacteria bacterium CG10_big_fil_rev_8_21_14_0_10_41_10 TaxID=1974551 RepID=A0A2H0VD29_9BACT|nr:MAG: methionyl-tRNA formyltransferase [Candidatus Doudnabacteria bacterium CG10_big_fil_rev_8_21_14_0_10_41_10]
MPRKPNDLKIIFFGSSDFAVPILNSLIQNNWDVVSVITRPDRPKGRKQELSPTIVKLFAQSKKITVLEFKTLKEKAVQKTIKDLGADIAVVASYGMIIPSDILRICRKGFINIHPSMLPKYRGPSPIQFTVLNGEIKTGVSFMEMDQQLDHGAIIKQFPVKVTDDDDYKSLHDRLSDEAASQINDLLLAWCNNEIHSKKQDDHEATFTKILTKEDGKIVWKRPAESIVRQIKAFRVWPGTWTTIGSNRLKIIDAVVSEERSRLSPGFIKIKNGKITVGCGNNSSIDLITLQPEGKNEMNAKDYANGFSGNNGKTMGI